VNEREAAVDKIFEGFQPPTENWSKLPHNFIGVLPLVKTIGELKIILYILRHTWGYQDVEKRITIDEFMHGRKRRDQSRIDAGTGLSKPTVLAGLKAAEAHGFVSVEIDARDGGRVKKTFKLCMSGVKFLYPCGQVSLPRSEKETIERNDDDGLPTACRDAYHSLVFLGVDPDVARTEAGTLDPDFVIGWSAALQGANISGTAKNLPGLILSKLRADNPVWPEVDPGSIARLIKDVNRWRTNVDLRKTPI